MWYRLESKYTPDWKIGGLTGDMRGQGIALTNNEQKWSRMQFVRIGGGWWRIVLSDFRPNDLGMSAGPGNPPPGTCFPRDVSIYYKHAQTATDLYWRFVPTKEKGWFYLVNYSVGEPSALTVDNYRCRGGSLDPPIMMRDFTNTAKTIPDVQYWRAIEVSP